MTTEPAKEDLRLIKVGDWGRDPVYHAGVDPAAIETTLAWLRDGDHSLLTAPGVADFLLTQHRALLRELDAKGHVLHDTRERIAADARTLNESFARPYRDTEAYSVGYSMGRYIEIDRMAEAIQQIADAGVPQPDAPAEPVTTVESKP